MKAFVTGATGLLGNNLLRALRAAGHDVVALVRSPAKAERLIGDTGATVVVGDMRDVAAFSSALAGCDAVFHTAAYFREAFERGADPAALEEINVRATLTLLEAADRAGAACFVHVGSGGVIGRKSDGSAGDEDTPPSPLQRTIPYFQSKLSGDAAIARWRPTAARGGEALRVLEVLPGWMWGPYDDAPTAAGKLLSEYVAGRIPAIIDGGTTIVDARDVADAMIRAAERNRCEPDQRPRYIVGGRYLSMARLLAALEKTTGRRAPRLTIPHAVLLAYATLAEGWGKLVGGDVLITREAVRTMNAKIAIDSGKAERELGLVFRPLDETFAASWAWMQANRPKPV